MDHHPPSLFLWIVQVERERSCRLVLFYPLAPRLANEKGEKEEEGNCSGREAKRRRAFNYEGDWYKGLGVSLEIVGEGGSDVIGCRRWSSHVV